MKLSEIKSNPNNPRIIKDDKFHKLVNSIKDFPQMMELRPIVIDENNIVLGGNMRLKALKELKYTEIADEWIKRASELTESEKQQFIIKDNVGFGDWDWELLTNEWNSEELESWGLDLEIEEAIDNLDDGEEIEFSQSVQIEPPKEYILIMAEPNSIEWEEIKDILKLKIVRRGGYKKGSAFDATSIERVLLWNDFKERANVNSSSK